MSDDLPTNYDVIVLGTGLTECIISAACSRIGKTVLHLDKNGYYGGDWASFSFEALQEWMGNQESEEQEGEEDLNIHWRSSFSGIESCWYIGERESPVEDVTSSDDAHNPSHGGQTVQEGESAEQGRSQQEQPEAQEEHTSTLGEPQQRLQGEPRQQDVATEVVAAGPVMRTATAVEGDQTGGTCVTSSLGTQESSRQTAEVEVEGAQAEATSVGASSSSQEHVGQAAEVELKDTQFEDAPRASSSGSQNEDDRSSSLENQESSGVSPGTAASSEVEESGVQQGEESSHGDTEGREGAESTDSGAEEGTASASAPPVEAPRTYYQQDVTSQSRRFNLDLAPQILFSRGSMVELLISSNISRYLEFRSLDNVLTVLDGHLVPVPCSRADVFASRQVSIVEKRILMKFLNYCLNHDEHPERYAGWEDRTFYEFMKSFKATDHVIHFVLYSIALADRNTRTKEGLERVQCFLKSLGRYGNTPFLHSMYGSGELPQAFCRLCAVFGGIQYLGRSVEEVRVDGDRVTGVRSRELEMQCDKLVIHPGYAPSRCRTQPQEHGCSRAVFITNKHLCSPTINLLRIHPHGDVRQCVNVLELGSPTGVCPQGFVVVYLWCRQERTAKDDLLPAAKLLLHIPTETEEDNTAEKPTALWSMFYSQCNWSQIPSQPVSQLSNLWMVPGDDGSLDPSRAVDIAREVFSSMYPGEEFLPRAPDPDEIIVEDVPPPRTHNDSSSNEEEQNRNGEEEGGQERKNEEEGREKEGGQKRIEEEGREKEGGQKRIEEEGREKVTEGEEKEVMAQQKEILMESKNDNEEKKEDYKRSEDEVSSSLHEERKE